MIIEKLRQDPRTMLLKSPAPFRCWAYVVNNYVIATCNDGAAVQKLIDEKQLVPSRRYLDTYVLPEHIDAYRDN